MRRLAASILLLAIVSVSGCASAGVMTAAGVGVPVAAFVGYRYLTKGGASSEKNLKRETGRVLSIDPDTVSVFEIHRGMTDVTWKAATPKGSYKCSADDMVRRPTCSKTSGTDFLPLTR